MMNNNTEEIEFTSLKSMKDFRSLVKDQMSIDIELLLEQYRNKDIGIRILSEKMNIGEKTLKRVITKKSDPHQNTIGRFYSYFFKVVRDKDKSHKIHERIKRYMAWENLSPQANCNYDMESILATNKVFRELYLYSRSGSITKEFVQEEFGRFGLEMVQIMLDENILIEIDRGLYKEGSVYLPKGPLTLKSVIQDLIKDHHDHEKLTEYGQNSAFYVIEGVTEKTRQKVLRQAEEFRREMINQMINQEEKGELRLFVLGVVDTLKERNIKGPDFH